MKIQEIFPIVRQIVTQAGVIIRRNIDAAHPYTTKSTPFDPVTVFDRQIEDYLKRALGDLLPGSLFVAEETAAEMKAAQHVWLIDPIDGTVNFVHRFPFTCVSVALLEDGQPIYGQVEAPLLNERFVAIRGQGATRNDVPIHVSGTDRLEACLLATGFPYTYATDPQNNLRQFDYFHQRVQGIRRPGSAALDLCYTAAGVFDGYWEWHLHPWDVGAGILLIEEAGGIVTNLQGEPYRFGDSGILAAGSTIHALLRAGLQETGV